MGLVNTGIKVPLCTMKYASGILMLWAYIVAEGPGHLCIHGIMHSVKYQQIQKNQ